MWHLVKFWNMLRYVYTIDYQRNYERSSTHMCQIVGIPSHSRVELQLIQDTKNDLYYYRAKEWNQHAIRILVRFDKNISFLKCHFKDEQEMNICEHMLYFCVIWHLFEVLHIYKNGNLMYIKWMERGDWIQYMVLLFPWHIWQL